MHFGAFKLSFEDIDEPLRWLKELASSHSLTHKLKILDEGKPTVF
jgi:hypothetical protein